MININGISISFEDKHILKQITYEFRPGYIYGIIGRNGAGKTTLLKIIMRIIRKNKGDIIINNENMNQTDTLDMPCVFISDTPVLYQDLTIKEQMLLVSKVQKIKKDAAMKGINNISEALKLDEYLDYFPRNLSRGTLQRVSIALGMMRESNIYLIDEPFNSLDPVQVSCVENLFLNKKQTDRTIIISSHDIDSLETICDKYLILKDGKILEFNPKDLNKEKITSLIGESYDG